MNRFRFSRRHFVLAGATAALAGCQVVPNTSAPAPRAPVPEETPSAEPQLPTDETRHRVALLVPQSGANASVGQSIANATTMALLDTNADNLRITTYDTAGGAQEAARRAIADGNKLILGPLLRDNVGAVAAIAQSADVPVISFSNDTSVAGGNVFLMGHIPEQSIQRSVQYASNQGATRFSAIIPNGDYGDRAEAAFQQSVRSVGGDVASLENYARSNTSIVSAAQRVQARGDFDAVLIADSPALAARAAREISGRGLPSQIIGTELWSGESAVTRENAFDGAIFSAVSDQMYEQFRSSYEQRFGSNPSNVARLGYDAVLLTLRISNDWRVGRDFPVRALRDSDGFLGLDGAFRFGSDGVAQRAMEVRKVQNGRVVVVSPAPKRFAD
ncbi:penicillin-binding protein activator [Qipengyuania atrilutea]|uniref:Penicillin-binding protein activator n=1 Tax=Qipengyuania atrilutea TaxID=2744473 RepID=A0A850H9N9_9SPHN|nr:penicillin-binding protein activator [Actirhodobacter atriluteus]NVD43789.1 penicillin-binding protein activator [Actirhodobacter atriluteus]